MKKSKAVVILGILMALMVSASWHRWLNPAIDSGREMNTPLRLLNGELLYCQVHYLHGPVAPYLNAGLYALFGSRLNTLYWAGILGSLALVLSVFYLGCRFLSPYQAMLAAVLVMVLCVFKESGNLVFPYSFAVLYGTLFGTLALFLMVHYILRNQEASLWASGILSGLAFCCKAEFGLAVAAALLALVITDTRGRRLRAALISLTGFSVIPVIAWALLFSNIPLESFFRDTFVFPGLVPDELLYFYRSKLGFNHPGRTFREMISAVALVFGSAGLFSMASIRFGRKSLGQEEKGVAVIYPPRLEILTAVSWGLLLLHLLIFGTRWDLNPLRALPLIFLLMICLEAAFLFRGGRDPSRRTLFVVTVYGLTVLARIITRIPAGGGYGAGLLPVPLMLFVWMATKDMGPFRVPDSARPRRQRAVVGFLTIILAATICVIAFRYRAHSNYEVDTPRGSFSVHPSIGAAMEQALEYIARNSRAGEYILSLPEGTSLNFLADRPVPIRYEILTPGFLDQGAEYETIGRLQEKDVRFVFLFNRPTAEFGAPAFGVDYYRTLMGWIEANYTVDAIFGNGVSPDIRIGDPRFFIKCYKKK